jgi:uncharacterized OsmC-like protein
MVTAIVEYLGGLRTKCTHVKSGVEVISDAPTDNNGKGDSFSPTDLVATAYASCMLTIVGIYCDQHEISFEYARAEVIKGMESGPRRIGSLEISLDFTDNNWDENLQKRIIAAAEACPVAKSVHEGMKIKTTYKFLEHGKIR